MSQDDFLTVQEAVLYSQKSEKTIRNIIDLLVKKNKNTSKTTSKDTSKVLVKKNGQKFFYLISRLYLKEKYNINSTSKNASKNNNTASKTTSNILNLSEREAIEALKETIETLKHQLEVKDEQLAKMQELVKNQQILSLNEKKTVQLENKQGFFQRLFKRKDEE